MALGAPDIITKRTGTRRIGARRIERRVLFDLKGKLTPMIIS
jgi:hypothetical protein